MFAKVSQPEHTIARAVQDFGAVDLVLLSGQFVGKKSAEIDLLIVGELDKTALKKFMDEEAGTEAPVKYTVFTLADFLYRLDCRDTFVLQLLADKSSTIAVNKIKKYIDARMKAAKK